MSYNIDRECRRRQLQAERARYKANNSQGGICNTVLTQWHMERAGKWFRWDWECPHVSAWGYAPRVYTDRACLMWACEGKWVLHPSPRWEYSPQEEQEDNTDE